PWSLSRGKNGKKNLIHNSFREVVERQLEVFRQLFGRRGPSGEVTRRAGVRDLGLIENLPVRPRQTDLHSEARPDEGIQPVGSRQSNGGRTDVEDCLLALSDDYRRTRFPPLALHPCGKARTRPNQNLPKRPFLPLYSLRRTSDKGTVDCTDDQSDGSQ